MNVYTRGVRNAFRNLTRTISIVIILGLSMGLALTMLIAHQAVGNKINSVKASVGNTVTIAPAGFSGFSSVNNSLTTSELSSVSSLPHVTALAENLTDRMTTIGSSQTTSPFGGSSSSNSNATTSLTSPVTLNAKNANGGSGPHLFISGGGSLPTNFSLPITLLATNDPTSISGNSFTLTSGKVINASVDNNQALISSAMASKNNLKVGSTFTAYGATLTVAGIFSGTSSTATQAGNNTVLVSLPTGQQLTGQTGDVTSATAYVDSLDNLSSATQTIKNKLGSSADVTSSVQQADNTVQPLNSVQSISLYSLIGAIIAAGVIILLTMVMIVRERTREIGVIKAIGASNSRVSLQFMSEAFTLTVIGAVVGMALAIVAASPITHLLVTNTTTSVTTSSSSGGGGRFGGGFGGGGGGTVRFASGGRGALGGFRNNFTNIHAAAGWNVLGFGLLAALLIALVGSAAVSYFIAKIRPAEVMRTE
jgi:putative ABC transport system permease protein